MGALDTLAIRIAHAEQSMNVIMDHAPKMSEESDDLVSRVQKVREAVQLQLKALGAKVDLQLDAKQYPGFTFLPPRVPM